MSVRDCSRTSWASRRWVSTRGCPRSRSVGFSVGCSGSAGARASTKHRRPCSKSLEAEMVLFVRHDATHDPAETSAVAVAPEDGDDPAMVGSDQELLYFPDLLDRAVGDRVLHVEPEEHP